MRSTKLKFSIQLKRKYNDINIENFIDDWQETQEERQIRTIEMENDLHIELGKFNTYNLNINEIIDAGLRYALGKKEFQKMMAMLIKYKQERNKIYEIFM